MSRFTRTTLFAATAAVVTLAAVARPQDPSIPEDTEIVTTESGLKYSVLEAGNGLEFPRFGDRVRVHYTGWLPEGKMFDSSRERGEPTEFGIGQVVEGWNEALQLMSPGARFKLTIPYALAYGEDGRPPTIPAKTDLIFDVELIAITARGLDYVEWTDGEGVVTTDSGLAYRTILEGREPACGGADLCRFEFALWDLEGKMLMGSAMQGEPLMSKADKLPLAFMKEGASLMKAGSRMIFKVPAPLAFGEQPQPGVPPGSTTIWQLYCTDVYDFEKPEFSLPDDTELVTTASGLKYQVLREGNGKSPAPTQQVTVHYAGWLTNGTGFDNSYDRGEPSSFPLNRVISGWTEGLQLMKEGAMVKFVIPGDLAYGTSGKPPKIGPNETLVFVVELIRVIG